MDKANNTATLAAAWLIASGALFALADDPKQPDKKPNVLVAAPLGIFPGMPARLMLRGLNLDQATQIRASAADKPLEVKLHGKQKVGVPPNTEAKKVGDSQAEFEISLPADTAAERLSIVVVSADGESKPYELPISRPGTLVVEQEPNDGFAKAQPIELGKVVLGRIDPPQNVDVFSFEGRAGQPLSLKIVAAELGSPLDCQLSLYDARGALVASHDDQPKSKDPRLELSLPASGKYFLSVSDANDQGGPTHGYRLVTEQ